MLFGFVIRPEMLVLGGSVLFALLVLQILVGMRKITFKGRRHMQVHKYGAWILVAFGVFHGLFGAIYAFGLRIG